MRVRIRVKLRHQMMLLIAGPTLVIYVVILGLAGLSLHRQSMSEAERGQSDAEPR